MAGYRRVKQVFVSSASLAAILIFTVLSFFFSPAPVQARPGDLDPSFGNEGFVALGNVYPIELLTENDGRLLVVSSEIRQRPNGSLLYFTVIQRYNPDGAADTTYAVRLRRLQPTAAVLQADGRLLLVARNSIPSANTPDSPAVLRLNADGTPDTTFGSNGRVTLPFTPIQFSGGNGLAVQADGKILIGGQAGTRLAVVRLNADGSLDTSYGRDGRFTTRLLLGEHDTTNILLQPDGRLVLGAVAFGNLTDEAVLGFVRVTPEGTLDTSFADGGRFMLNITTVLADSNCLLNTFPRFTQQADGKLLGSQVLFCLSADSVFSRLLLTLRVNADGSLDTTYGTDGIALNQQVSFTRITDLAVDSAGRLLIAGSVNDIAALARLTPSGALDADFGTNGVAVERNFPFNTEHTALAFAPDGRILTTGALNQQNPLSVNSVLSRYLIGDLPPATVPPSAFTLQFPQDDQRLEGGVATFLGFAWGRARNAATYTLEVYKISDNVRLGLTFSKTVNADTTFVRITPAELAQFTPGTYAWTVTASNAAGSIQADGRVFSVNAPFDELGLIFNGSFEQGLTGWQTRRPGQGDRVVCNSTERRVSFAGACAYRVTGNAGENSSIGQQFADNGLIGFGDRLTLSAALRNISAQADRPVVVLVVTYFEGGRDRVTLRLPAAGGEYTRLSAPLVLSGTLAAVRLEVRDANTNGVFFVDDVRLVLEPNLDALRSTADGLIPLPAAPLPAAPLPAAPLPGGE